jgi:hypothetical protein
MNEIERLRLEQVRCAQAAREAKTQAEREFAMLGVGDYFTEELLLTFWCERIHAAIEKQENGEHRT